MWFIWNWFFNIREARIKVRVHTCNFSRQETKVARLFIIRISEKKETIEQFINAMKVTDREKV